LALIFVGQVPVHENVFRPSSRDETVVDAIRHLPQLQTPEARSRCAKVVPTIAAIPARGLPNVHDDMRIMQENIFGPALPIVTYRDLDDGI
jgi:coniferyl-aldehyde dehydrogenase